MIQNTINKFILVTTLFIGISGAAWDADADYARSLAAQITQISAAEIYGEFDGIPHANTLYRALPENFNWRDGYTTVFVGFRKPGYPVIEFAQKMASHIDFVRRAFRPSGLRGYLFFITGDYEVAYQNWTSKEDMERAFQSENGHVITEGANRFMDGALFEQVQDPEWLNKIH